MVDEERLGGDRDLCCDNPHYEEEKGEDGGPVIFLVANGHPYKGSPYAPRAAWDEMRSL